MTTQRFAGKVAIVTGASSGIGCAVARRLAANGAKIVATGRNASALRSLVDELISQGADAMICEADLLLQEAPKKWCIKPYKGLKVWTCWSTLRA